jgi:photosystem II stability/assembly factor-like uncharacterized protein
MPSRRVVAALLAYPILAWLGAWWTPCAAQRPAATDQAAVPGLWADLPWREVGPYRGGRCAAVTGLESDPDTYYFGSTGGGVWKSTDSGRTWRNVSDGWFGGSIGAVAVATSDPNVVYAGGGEKTVRGNVSAGDGVWRSTDAARTWTHVGLSDSRHVCRIRVHPRDPDLVYAAALGHLFGPNGERGVFRSRDGGGSWQRVLHMSDEAGAVDLCMDPTNPRILYASLWRVRRTPWSLESGGEGSGIWKSTDAGDTWQELTRNPGMPAAPIGISGVAVSRTDPQSVYAIIEAEEGGVFRSRDGGATWKRQNAERALRQRAWYYSRIYADPADAEAVYVVNVRFHRSVDGGKTFSAIATPHGDNHDLWIDPADPKRMIESNDGGANVSRDGGATWSPQDNQPTAQIYRVSVDNAVPYRLLGAQQDNSALRIRSRSLLGSAIGPRDWEPTAGGESGHVVAKPDDPEVVFGGSYGGFLSRLDHRTGERRSVNPWPDDPMGSGAGDNRYRFQWNFPLFFSPHDPALLYAAAQCWFASRDGGASWQVISGDLTRRDDAKLAASGGPITKDNTGVEYYGTVFAALESPHEPGVLWAGSDDGLIHLSRDAGKTWDDVTPAELPEWTLINSIEAHPTERGGLYVAATRYKLDDFQPYLYKTADYGRSWQRIDRGIDPQHFTRVIRADPDRSGLLYAGTERGVYASFDDGASWQSLQGKLPVVPVTDLALAHGNLIAATQGRGFWILDDLSVLHQYTPAIEGAAAHLFQPRPTLRLNQGRARRAENAGTNPAVGAVFHYLLGKEPDADAEVRLDLLEENGDLIRSFTRRAAEGSGASDAGDDDGDGGDSGDAPARLEARRGLNAFTWDLRYPPAKRFAGMVLWNGRLTGPRAVPGAYQARLTVGEYVATVPFEVLPDPLSSATQEDRVAQFLFLRGLRDAVSEIHGEIENIRAVRSQLHALIERCRGRPDQQRVVEAAEALDRRITTIEAALYQTNNRSRQDPLNFPIRLNDKLAGLMAGADAGDQAPTAQATSVRDELVAAAGAQLAELREAWSDDLPALNQLARDSGVAAVVLGEAAADGGDRR